MNTQTHRRLGALTLGSLALAMSAASGLAGPIDFTIDPERSSLDMSIEVDVGIASSTDSATSTLSGNIEFEFDRNSNPGAITIHDLMVVLDQTMDFNWPFSFFGSAQATMTGASMSYATPKTPTGPVPISDGGFVFPSVSVLLDGELDVSYDILIVGSGAQVVVLGDQGAFSSEFVGDLVVDGEVATITTTLPLSVSQPFMDDEGNELGTVTTTGTATIVAVGTIPGCRADLDGNDELDFFDVSAFLDAFGAGDPVADFDDNGAYDFFDVSAFLDEFGSGCP